MGNSNTSYASAIVPLIHVGGGIAVYFAVVKPLFEKLGLKDSKEDKETDKAAVTVAFNPKYWEDLLKKKTIDSSKLITTTKAKELAKIINSAIDEFPDNKSKIITAIKQIRTKAQLSQIVFQFNIAYKNDLFTALRSSFSDKEMVSLIKLINSLPNY